MAPRERVSGNHERSAPCNRALEDQSVGYGMRSDQERLLEREFQRFVRLNWEIVWALVRAC